MPALSITRVSRASPGGGPLSPAELQDLLISCLPWCPDGPEFRLAPQPAGAIYRSPELAKSAHSVFPKSCHTPFDGALSERFDTFARTRLKLGPPLPGAAERARDELQRRDAFLVVDWTASLFDGALSP
jgi:hypothetical protein